MKKKQSLKSLKAKLWKLCKEKVRGLYGNVCYTCGKTGLVGPNWHTGHMIPKSVCGAYLKFDIRNLRPQCFHCNINLGGNGAEFLRRMTQREGKEYVDVLFDDKNRVCKETLRVLELLQKYAND